ncbi:RDD family protein [Vibrio sp. Of7-15]|uniref:RDD family protein n=1 Tax=Vibrio sp. Of7-15 TaxID=2724879 RepID=UPI001EF1FB18|nr:RDD family protein [Vibrio sp. Of7-15]MCG7499219.1 RDD family protein [Vibrio sp. Of7-15]
MTQQKKQELNLSDESQLASRWSRLSAALIDMIISLIFLLPLIYFTGGFDGFFQNPPVAMPLSYQILLSILSIGLYCAINWSLLAKKGQTVGKNVMDMRIVNLDGTQPSRTDILVKRYAPYVLIPYIPFIGTIVSFIGIAMIFGKQKRCLHERIAGTKVIKC